MKSPQLIWIAFMMAPLFYGGAAYFMATRPGAAVSTGFPLWVLPVVALVTAGVSFVLGRSWLEAAVEAGDKPDGPDLAPWIRIWAMDEAVAIYGLVHAFITRDTTALPAFIVLSLFLLWLHRP